MKKLFIFFLLGLIACRSKKENIVHEKISYSTKYAKNIQIIQHKKYIEVQLINPDKKAIEKKYALAKNFDGLKLQPDFIPIKTPINSIVALSGTDIGMLEKINCSDKIAGVLNIKYVNNQTVKNNYSKNKVKEIHDLSQINPENLIGISKVITYSGFGKSINNEEKLVKLGIVCIPNYDWKEIHPLGKAEWIKFYGILFDKEIQANQYFQKIEREFLELVKIAQKLEKKPGVLSGSMIGDFWYMPAGDSYNANLLKKAMCNFVGQKKRGTGSSAFTFEYVLKNFQNAKFWLNPGFKSKKELIQSNSKYAFFDAYKNDQIYCYSHNMNHFWEMSSIEPQKVLSDLIQILHAGEIPKKNLYFYKKIRS